MGEHKHWPFGEFDLTVSASLFACLGDVETETLRLPSEAIAAGLQEVRKLKDLKEQRFVNYNINMNRIKRFILN